MACQKDPLAVNNIPRYLYSFTVSSTISFNLNWGPDSLLDLLKITILVLSLLTFKSAVTQYSFKMSRDFCNPL